MQPALLARPSSKLPCLNKATESVYRYETVVKDDLDFPDFDEVEPTVIGFSKDPVEPPPEDGRSRSEKLREWLVKHRYVAAVVFLFSVMLLIELGSQWRSGRISIPLLAESEGVAKVIGLNGDTRYQPLAEEDWYKAKIAADVFSGDAIYSGKRSDALVEMGSGGQIAMGEETLVVFDSHDGVTVPDVTRGNVRLRITGEMRISISGNSAVFSAGEGAEVLITVEEGRKGKIQVLSGAPKIQTRGQADRVVQTGSSFVMDLFKSVASKKTVRPPADLVPEAEPVQAPLLAETQEPTVSVEPPTPAEQLTTIAHTLTQSDLYEKVTDIRLREKPRAREIRAAGLLRWSGGTGEAVILQIAKVDSKTGEANFENPWFQTQAKGQDLSIDSWRVGRSAWRVSQDGKTWSHPATIDVVPRFAAGREPLVVFEASKVTLPDAVLPLRMRDSSGRKMMGWIIEGSRQQDFKKSIIVWADADKILIPLSKVGRYYFRVRSVDEQGEISTFSVAQHVDVEAAPKKVIPPKPIPLRLAKKTTEAPAENLEKSGATKPPRELANVETSSKVSVKLERQPMAPPFRRAGPWSVSLLGGLSSVISGVQVGTGEGNPSVDILGFVGSYFDGAYEGHLDFRTRLGVITSSSAPDFTRLDLRVGRWWTVGTKPLGIKTRVGVVTGFENYSNKSGRGSHAPFYDVAKLGLGIGFDLTPRIQTGGAFLYGAWLNSDRLTEIDGYVAYDVDESLNLGFGYRVGLFEAGSAESSPNRQLPYREASGEAYSRLKISF